MKLFQSTLLTFLVGALVTEVAEAQKKESSDRAVGTPRAVDLSVAVDFGACPNLPANRVASNIETTETLANNNGWLIVDMIQDTIPIVFPDGNDDGSSVEIPLGFTFSLFGIGHTSLFINNNGNVSFGAFVKEFSSTGFPVADIPMMAPFWADIDTRGTGLVWWRQVSATEFAVAWDHVGYHQKETDKTNTFSIYMNNGAPGAGQDNVCFCYEQMEWTTGFASSGVNGFGGTPATVGGNKGDDVLYFEIGRYDTNGTGPMGVGSLDGATVATNMCFEVANENIPPTVLGVPTNNTVDLGCGESTTFDLRFFAVSGNTLSFDFSFNPDFDYALSYGGVPEENTATVVVSWTPTVFGQSTLETINATDSAGTITTVGITYNYNCDAPTMQPSAPPTSMPTSKPTTTPFADPTSAPTVQPTSLPTSTPTTPPTSFPTETPPLHKCVWVGIGNE